ncbi:PREDICTED: uncharacterized protein LOC106811193 [Priapulus caudatus]|uniref:Uncharacterized protein LOC106811193 n=1 Tax=Priapulus caudatus TaxID=37621 RepID=A0ABM1EDF5_PRICU|nr:PREDICTED: uncharacterized protein LOC106811193 [Priapulus caudatus]
MSATCAEDDRKHRQTIPRQHSTDCEEMSAAHLVNGIKTTGLAYNEVVRILRWAPTVVTLRLRRHADTVGSLTSLDIPKGRLSCEDCEASLDDSDMDSNTRSRKKRIMTEKLRAFSRRPLKGVVRPTACNDGQEILACRHRAEKPRIPIKQFVLISLAKPVDGSFGFVVSGSKKGVFVKQIAADGPAAQEGRLKVGDQLVQINERSVIGQAPNKVIMTLRAVHGEVDFVFARKRRFSISELPRPSASRSASPIHLNRRSASPSPIRLNRRSASASPLHLNRRSASASPTAAATATPRSSRRSSSVVRTDSWPRESQAELTAPASRARHTSAGGVSNSASNTSINIRRQPSATTAASTDRVALDARELLTKESSLADLHNTAGYLDCQPSGKHENSAYGEDTAGRLENQTSVKCRETADLHSRANYPDQQSAGGYKLNTVSYLDQQTPGKYKLKTVSYRDQQPAGGYKLNTVGYLDQHPSGEYNLNALHYFENKPRSKYCQLSNPENNADYHIDRQPSGKYWQLTDPHNTVGHQDSQASGKRANIPAPPSSPRAHGQRLSSTVLYCQAFPSNNWRRQQLLKQTRHSDGNLLETYRGEREEEPRGQRNLEADDSNDCERAPTTLRSQSYRDVSTHGRQPVEGKAVLDELKAALENRREESPDVCSTAMPLLDVRTPCTLSKADSWPRHMQTAGDSIDRRQMSSAVSSHRYLPTLGGVHHAADDVNLDDVFNDYDDVTDGCRDMYLISNYSDKYNRNVKI